MSASVLSSGLEGNAKFLAAPEASLETVFAQHISVVEIILGTLEGDCIWIRLSLRQLNGILRLGPHAVWCVFTRRGGYGMDVGTQMRGMGTLPEKQPLGSLSEVPGVTVHADSLTLDFQMQSCSCIAAVHAHHLWHSVTRVREEMDERLFP